MSHPPLDTKNAARIDHYGRAACWFMDYPPDYLDRLAAEIKAIDLIMQVEFGLQVFLTYGTLLGAVREGDFIGHDSDIDLTYVSRFDTEAEIAAERAEIRALFDAVGRVTGRPSPGRFMMQSVPTEAGVFDHGIELFTSFIRDGRYFGYSDMPGTLPAETVLPLGNVRLRGLDFAAPADTDAYLSAAIAPDWRIPKLPKDHPVPNRRYPCFGFLYPPDPG